MSGDWVVATLACLSAGAMVGGICFRNFGAPRLASVMIILSLGPACLGGALSGEPILYVTLLQIPLYLISMAMASHKLNAMLIATKLAERENERRDDQDLTAFAASISENIGERIRLNVGSSVEVGSSMGIALAPRHGSAAGVLLDKADKALYQAKAAGKNRHAIAL
eukprot:gene7185-8849_t